MKTTQAETKLVEFLTNTENLPFSLEILRLGNEIRRPILERFRGNLKCQLDRTRPSGIPPSMVLRFLPAEAVAKVDCLESSLENQRQFLFYGIRQEQGKGRFLLYYGIAWRDASNAPSKSAGEYQLEPVVRLRKKLDSMDFERGQAWIGWRPLHECAEYESIDEFVAAIATAPAIALRDTAERFWSLVQETLPNVERANRAIVGKD